MSQCRPTTTPTRDLDTPEEVAEMVRRFYQDVAQDPLLGPIFIDVAQVDWNEHLPKLAAFWNRVLLGIPGFTGNPMRAHVETHEQVPFTPAHFDRWLTLFHDTVGGGWTGPMADQAMALARNVARVHSQHLTGRPFEWQPDAEAGDPACWSGLVWAD
ncbi:MAG: group III truncated hemoglobin [Microthrixaceae bacterium]|jgi:hemoglobin|nr:group III truncated hemoglobin [Microthrixaceae bacterium]